MERVGRGTLRLIAACREAGLPTPTWEVGGDGVTLTLHSRASGEKKRREHVSGIAFLAL